MSSNSISGDILKKRIKPSDIALTAGIIGVFVSFFIAVGVMSGAVTQHYEKKIIVCLDAGHGASDNGAVSADGKRLEKNDNLNLTLTVGEKLRQKGISVLYTRSGDSEITLKQRCKIANKYHCNLFVSIHRNSSATGTGIEAWISNAPKGNEKELAQKLVNDISTVTDTPNRGVKSGYRDSVNENYYINANTNMPSLLLEVGFVTSREDNEAFDKKCDEIAETVAEDLYNFLSENIENG